MQVDRGRFSFSRFGWGLQERESNFSVWLRAMRIAMGGASDWDLAAPIEREGLIDDGPAEEVPRLMRMEWERWKDEV